MHILTNTLNHYHGVCTLVLSSQLDTLHHSSSLDTSSTTIQDRH